ncbi:hypothetical protein SmJEL517_g01239 [Synchytrium microbalum]|uniref:Homeobox domain-containing protein n=1 Tax=Synchytrium microbalum TaxID=1806994 RepID=A0A507C686_9FUNG|nr:uncharacterized protein SmJEL517_g01239 [Synchytrium microbalum]TPX36547.1 hypothetical protein SmJEL517_g01239 [Synchytrium microbalum]
MFYDPTAVFQARRLSMNQSFNLDVTLAQLLSPVLATPIFQYLNFMDETSNLKLSLPDSSSEWTEYLGKDILSGHSYSISDMEIQIPAYSSPAYSSPAASEESFPHYSNGEMSGLEAGIDCLLSPITLDFAKLAIVRNLLCQTIVDTDNNKCSGAASPVYAKDLSSQIGSLSPVYEATDVAPQIGSLDTTCDSNSSQVYEAVSRIYARRDSGIEFEPYMPQFANKDIVNQAISEEDTYENPDVVSSNDSDDDEYDAEVARKHTSKSRRNSAVTAGNGRITKPSVKVLSKVFELTCYPETNIRELLAKKMDMKPRAVQIWFQNKRQHLKASGVSEGLRTKKGGDTFRAPVDQVLPEDVEMWCAEAGF